MASSSNHAGKRKVALVVLGMHRSGTSAMTRVLSLAGAKLPTVQLPTGPDNVDGHWEPLEVIDLNEKILSELDSSWSDTFGPRGFRTKPLQLEQYLDEACDVLRRNYDGEACIVLKEPRMSILVDLWASALRREGFEPGFIIMVRHPLEVAESLKARNGFVREKSLMLWTTYMLAAELSTRRDRRIFVRYDDLMADPESTLDAIEAGLMVQLPKRSWDATLEIQEFLKPDRRHHVAGDRRINSKPLTRIEKLYEYFEAAGKGQPWNADVADEVGAWLSSVEDTAGILIKAEERQLRAAREEAESWARRAEDASRRSDALEADLAETARDRDSRIDAFKAELAEIVRERDSRERASQASFAERENAHRARASELEERLRESERERAAAVERAVAAGEAALRTQLAALEARLGAERDMALAMRERAHREQLAAAEQAISSAEAARIKAEIEAAQWREEADRRGAAAEIKAGNLTTALQKAEADHRAAARELSETREKARSAETDNAALANEARASQERSSELARELTSIIADRGRLSRYSALELQLAALRRLWPF